MTGAKAIVASLEQEGVTTVFGYPGAAICPVYDCLSDSPICHILVRQEQNAGHAAAAYGRISGRPGVCIATSGPGALNLLTALATAYMDSVPLVIITGQVESKLIGRNAFQETDIIGMTRPIVKHSYLVMKPEELSQTVTDAFYLANSGRPGPVWIDIPKDVQQRRLEFRFCPEPSPELIRKPPAVTEQDCEAVLAAIARSRRPCIYAGGGVIAAGRRRS